jgi:class 3 adenylate cyclase
MRCPSCDHDNRAERRFCAECGAALAPVCASCGASNQPGEKFCGGCGRRLDVSAAHPSPDAQAPEADALGAGSRRQLTVLFCDLVGSTELSARLDPEDLRALVQRYQGEAGDVVARYGGHVAQYLGDGVVVYFGFPEAHENDPERAVRAGLEIVEVVGAADARLAVRVGIHTGLVVVAEMGGGERADTVALGETPNVAARVQALATPGTVVVTAATHRLVAGLFIVEEGGTHELKGVPRPVAVYRVVAPTGVRGRLDVAARHGLTPFVGRESERRLLVDRWEQARDGDGQVVQVVGEAGIGKSRLVQTLREHLTSSGEPHVWVECVASPFFTNTPFYPVVEMLRQALAWRGDESDEERLASLEQALALARQVIRDAIPLLAPLLGLALPDRRYAPAAGPPDQQRRRLLAMLASWCTGTARTQPAVMVVEDLHWVDPSTVELLTLLVDQGATVPLLLVYTARPEFRAPWALRAHHTQVTLNRLGRRHTREMARQVGTRAALTDEVVEAVAGRTDGVPLFVEELVKAVIEAGRGGTGHEIPTTLADSLMARLDRLGPAKEVAQEAAVLGREFSYALLRAVSPHGEREVEEALRKLADAELLYVRGVPPEATYLFKHALVQDAAYQSLLRARRRELHRRVGEVLTAEFRPLADERPELLAQHWSEAGESLRAVEAWQRAGEQTIGRGAHAEAAAHFRSGLDVLALLDESPERDRREVGLQVTLGQALMVARGYSAEETADAFRRARELGLRLGDTPGLANVLFGLGTSAISRGRLRETRALADEMLRVAEAADDRIARVWAYQLHGFVSRPMGELARADEEFDRTLGLYEETPGPWVPYDPSIPALAWRALVAAEMGRADTARRFVQEGLARARQSTNPFDVAWAHTGAVTLHTQLREPEETHLHVRAIIAIAGEHGFEIFAGVGEMMRGHAFLQAGDLAQGIQVTRAGLARLRAIGTILNAAGSLAALGESLVDGGAVDEARATVDEAEEAIGEERLLLPRVLTARAKVMAAAGADPVTTEELYREAIAAAQSMGAKVSELGAATGLARFLHARGRTAEARHLLAPAYASFTEGLDTRDLKDAKALLDDLA